MWNQPLKNKKNSCYIDVVLTALFINPSDAAVKAMNSIACAPSSKVCGTDENSVQHIQAIIRDVAAELEEHSYESKYYISIDELRQSAKKCPVLNNNERFDRGSMNDPSVFMEYLVHLFPCLKIKNSKGQLISPLINLETGPLKDINGFDLSDVVDNHMEKNSAFNNPPLIVFDLTRLNSKGEYEDDIEVIPDEFLNLSGTKYQDVPSELSAVVVWKDFHYTVYAKVEDIWYYFDDTDKFVEKVGTYEDLLSHNDNFVSMDAKLFFYVQN